MVTMEFVVPVVTINFSPKKGFSFSKLVESAFTNVYILQMQALLKLTYIATGIEDIPNS